MTHKVISPSFVIPTALAIVLGFVLSSVYSALPLSPVDQAEAKHVTGSRAELSDVRFSRVHLLLSNMK